MVVGSTIFDRARRKPAGARGAGPPSRAPAAAPGGQDDATDGARPQFGPGPARSPEHQGTFSIAPLLEGKPSGRSSLASEPLKATRQPRRMRFGNMRSGKRDIMSWKMLAMVWLRYLLILAWIGVLAVMYSMHPRHRELNAPEVTTVIFAAFNLLY